ncbi:MAG: hypothetical protein HRF40_05445 [Nitrososphaera sp.]|jgi:hypothetical protein
MSDRPAGEEVKIKLKHGEWEVEITCLEGRVKQVVENVLSSLDATKIVGPAVQSQFEELRREIAALKSRPVPGEFRSDEQKPSAKGGMTCRGLLESLWFEGFFGSERSLGEVHEELSRRGYNYDRTAVSHSLTDMVRENILTRIGTMRNYRYIQKRPPSDAPPTTTTGTTAV